MNNSNLSITTSCTALIADRVKWEEGDLFRSNNTLHNLLGGGFKVYEVLLANPFKIKEIDALLKAKKIPFTAATHPASKLIRLIFGDGDRRRVSAYAAVLMAAEKEADLASADFGKWVKGKGGVEAIRTGKTKKGDATSAATKDPEAFNKAAAKLSKEPAIATTTPSSKFPDGTGYVMVLARIAPDRSLSVVKFIGEVNDDRAKSQVIKVVTAKEKELEAAMDKLVDKSVRKATSKVKADEKKAVKKAEKDAEEQRKWQASEFGEAFARKEAEEHSEEEHSDGDGQHDFKVELVAVYTAAPEEEAAKVAA